MNVSSRCPTSTDLRDLLDGNISDADQAAVVAHLDECSGCQQSLEAIASPDSSFAVTLLEQAAYKAPEASSAYWPALKNAEQALTHDAATPRSSTEISLAFLEPPSDGSHLGTLANFTIVRIIGRGGMGIVLHAVDTCLQRDVAIKILDPELSKDELAVTRFCRESRAAASISHENVVAVHQVEEDEAKNIPFLVMELITGESLETKLQREGRLSLPEIVRIGMQTAAGLAAAHEKGLIHRDIKPGNILLEQSGLRVKLTDFGLARAAEDVRLTRSGLVAGTPLYMSPEQASGDELDARSDLFSLGVVLYELAAGEPPFNGKTPLAVLKQVTEGKPVPLKERNPDLPDWFVQMVDHLLAKKPEDRFQSARELANTLEHFWALLKSSQKLVCPKKKIPGPWKTITLGVAAGLLTLLLGTAAVYFFVPGRERGDDKVPAALHVFKGNAGPLWSMAITKDGNNLAMGNDDGTVKFWDIATEKVLWTLSAHQAPVWTLALSPDGDYLATGSDDGKAIIWDMKTRNEFRSLTNTGGVRAVAFDSTGKKLITGGRNGAVKVWNVQSGEKLLETKKDHAGLVVAVAFSPDGKTFASASSDKTIKIWDAASGGLMLTMNGHETGVYGIAFSPSNAYLASGSWDRTVRLWDLGSGTQIAKLEGHSEDVWSVAFNRDGTLLASGGEDRMVRIWNVETKKEAGIFRGSAGAILNVRFSPTNDNALVVGGKDGTARLWNLADLRIPR
jgi:WD40 repeat protein/serine/threonine protein kinase